VDLNSYQMKEDHMSGSFKKCSKLSHILMFKGNQIMQKMEFYFMIYNYGRSKMCQKEQKENSHFF